MKYESRIELRVSKPMHAAWTMAAKKADQSLGDWIRSVCEASFSQRVAKLVTAPDTGLGTVKAKTPRVAGSTPAPLTNGTQGKGFCRGQCIHKKDPCPPATCNPNRKSWAKFKETRGLRTP